jgi:hypothetical protein
MYLGAVERSPVLGTNALARTLDCLHVCGSQSGRSDRRRNDLVGFSLYKKTAPREYNVVACHMFEVGYFPVRYMQVHCGSALLAAS